jgi:hypothetical protein
MNETSKAIHDLAELIGHYHIQEVKLSTKSCDYYLTHLLAIVAERDAARRLYCHAQARIPDGRPEQLAQTLGWDCFATHANTTDDRVQNGGET